MWRALATGLLIYGHLISVSAADNEYPRCNCDEEGFWSIENILECQKAGDFLIAVAYLSIPIELIYFVTCSNLPFKWVIFQFTAFIVLCGMSHLLNCWTYGPHAFQLTLALTIFKFLTALVSCATAITLLTLFPLLLKVKIREFMLKKKTWDLDREVGIIKKQREAGLHVRMLTREIRKSLDRHTILYTTLVELSKILVLQNCAVWMPNENRTEMILTHDLKERNLQNSSQSRTIPYCDPDVRNIKGSEGVKILSPESALAAASSGGSGVPGAAAAIRMPMLRVSNFKGGTPELITACYAVLILVLPCEQDRSWTVQELEIIEVVADQVAVAISHAAVLEESQHMRDELVEQNRALQRAKKNAMMARQARNGFQKVMGAGMRRPLHSILGLLSSLQDENFDPEQQLIVDALVKTGNVLSVLINDAMDESPKEDRRFPSDLRSFTLHALIKEAGCLAKCLCVGRGFSFGIKVDRSLPDQVMGDERRAFQVILHMVGNLLEHNNGRGGTLTFHVFPQHGSLVSNDQISATWTSGLSDSYVYVRFEIGIISDSILSDDSVLITQFSGQRCNSKVVEGDLSFSVCQDIVQLMQGNIWIVPNPQGFPQSMALVLRFKLRPTIGAVIPKSGDSSEQLHRSSLFKGLNVLLADDDDMIRAVTQKLLEKLGCIVTAVSSGFGCLSAVGPSRSSPQIIILDLHMHDLDGFEVATRIRRFCSRNRPLIIALTSNADEDVWERLRQTGINGVIEKPILMQGIIDELRRVLLPANSAIP
ncbi:hypothetical protein Nepgr_010355 [Nepenthes gracilis]|uniref:Ethylene receptor n=1 Tax=Nepenthes gracilis TaxID=150966 RepID=A0AAD3SCX0_NEPGR|nr:hypothetical protein Nepgr_010355 [Nepenthes gracilis]